ncbi:UNVERIFIED_CONTAM: hypothetical protein Sradi_3400600 [Sesamum radiatum]|uniref:Uncharacterized protein n=1 Tax=Sesamum radiatum TaxID=300843 RepID=A0AAW2R4R9_SESRA
MRLTRQHSVIQQQLGWAKMGSGELRSGAGATTGGCHSCTRVRISCTGPRLSIHCILRMGLAIGNALISSLYKLMARMGWTLQLQALI